MPNLPVTIEMIEAAARRLAGKALLTPLVEHPALNERAGGRVLLKCETLQRVGAFKFRGAYNKIVQLDRARYPGGVVACSSGNHAQGVAAAATMLGIRSALVMPSDAPPLKIKRTRAFGGEVISYDREREDREAISRRLCEERGAEMVHPFDDPEVMAGQGTAGLELMAQAAAMGATPDAVLANASGGGLAGGVAVAVRHVRPATEVWAVEPAGFDDLTRSLASGRIEKNVRLSGSICDSLLAQSPGPITFAVGMAMLTGGLVVTDAEAAAAMRFAFEELKLVVEPGGAAGLAAVLSGKLPTAGRTIGVILSGGNVDPVLYARILAGEI